MLETLPEVKKKELRGVASEEQKSQSRRTVQKALILYSKSCKTTDSLS